MNTFELTSSYCGNASEGFELNADRIAQHFGWPVERFHDFMQRGMVTGTVERGEGEDEGHWRLTVRCGNRRYRAIVDCNGSVTDEHIEIVTSRSVRASGHNRPRITGRPRPGNT